MRLIHKLDDFLLTMFPELTGNLSNNDLIIKTLQHYYSFENVQPKVYIQNDFVFIDIDFLSTVTLEADFKKAVALCEQGNFAEAKPILLNLIAQKTTQSECYRIVGQIFSEEGNQDQAINYLIDALRWDSKNGYALLMMGNIFSKFKNDLPTAMKYYDQALAVNPNDYITMNNIGENLMQQGKFEEAKKYFHQSLAINQAFPNAPFALGIIAEMENDLLNAFEYTILALKNTKEQAPFYQKIVKQAFEIAQKNSVSGMGKKSFTNYRHKLEFVGAREIVVKEDDTLKTAAKIELAENYHTAKHFVKFNPSYPCVEHLIMHELVHLDFVIEARKQDLNLLFTSDGSQKNNFLKTIDATLQNLQKLGYSKEAALQFGLGIFDGINLQAYNTPIDLLIENFLHQAFADLRPYQFLSCYRLMTEAIKAVTQKEIVAIAPQHILSCSKIYSITLAMQFRDLYGIDLLKEFKATVLELKQAQTFYDEFLEYKNDRQAAEEYELVQHWADDLKLSQNFDLIFETEYRNKRTDIDNLLESIENDPFDLDSDQSLKEKDMTDFQKSQEDVGVNMAVAMYMLEALQYFEPKPQEEIKKIAFEIAMLGTHGFTPTKQGYKLASIDQKEFSGYHILAYYYVSFALAIPEMLTQLQLPYDKEYQMALTMYNPIG